jgi:hypothetical protein
MRRKRGGQPNNRNAYKYGIFSKFFNPFERRALSDIPLTDISGEIGIIRINVERFMQSYTASLEELDYDSRLAGLRAITMAVGRIAALQRIQSTTGKNLAALDELEKALEGVPEYDPDDPSNVEHYCP